ncbi:hypothetical protein ILUMI_06487 [Ignelater luminosus]|uniref:Uncharacterized protein n=1 Tax=Ignelater luminosus TaxID=2038154 RepID=A0A8K0DAK7_IGNLU|nr:hypothetical protein ILUMI_06487 [Ignelater luminosus]
MPIENSREKDYSKSGHIPVAFLWYLIDEKLHQALEDSDDEDYVFRKSDSEDENFVVDGASDSEGDLIKTASEADDE